MIWLSDSCVPNFGKKNRKTKEKKRRKKRLEKKKKKKRKKVKRKKNSRSRIPFLLDSSSVHPAVCYSGVGDNTDQSHSKQNC